MPGRFGNRKPPTAAYAGDSPNLYYDEETQTWFGGMFWDGRAIGWTLGEPLAEQAMGPFLNPLEMNMPGARQVCIKVAHSDYAGLFEEVWGPGSLDFVRDVDTTYERIRSIAAYEKSTEVNPFSSKFDLFWDNANRAGKNVIRPGLPADTLGRVSREIARDLFRDGAARTGQVSRSSISDRTSVQEALSVTGGDAGYAPLYPLISSWK